MLAEGTGVGGARGPAGKAVERGGGGFRVAAVGGGEGCVEPVVAVEVVEVREGHGRGGGEVAAAVGKVGG